MERHISGPREVRKGCDKGEEWEESAPFVGESRRGRGNGCGWCWLNVEARREGGKKRRQWQVVCCLLKEGQLKNTAERDLVMGVTRNKSDIGMESDSLLSWRSAVA